MQNSVSGLNTEAVYRCLDGGKKAATRMIADLFFRQENRQYDGKVPLLDYELPNLELIKVSGVSIENMYGKANPLEILSDKIARVLMNN